VLGILEEDGALFVAEFVDSWLAELLLEPELLVELVLPAELSDDCDPFDSLWLLFWLLGVPFCWLLLVAGFCAVDWLVTTL